MSDANRCKFLDLLPLSKDNTIALEIGCGLGQHTAAIARRVKHLDVLEVRLLSALFTKIRCEQNSLENVNFACGGDDCRIPYPNDTYDIVILNLVLEWCANGAAELPAEHGQHRMLSEIRRVLKPRGIVQLNTKNRFSYRLIIGGRDEHCAVRKRSAAVVASEITTKSTAWSFALVWCASAAGSACWLISDFNLLGCSRNAVRRTFC